MVTCYPVLRQQMRDLGITYAELASAISMDATELYLKMLGIKRWKLTEVFNICCFFRTNDAERLFRKKFCLVCSKIL